MRKNKSTLLNEFELIFKIMDMINKTDFRLQESMFPLKLKNTDAPLTIHTTFKE